MKRFLMRAVAIAVGTLASLLITGACPLWAQSNPLSADVKRDYASIRDYFIRAAEKMPEENYGFKPSPDVRSFGQQIAHVADDQYNLCAPARGETRKEAYTHIEDTLSKNQTWSPRSRRLSRIAMPPTTR